MNDHETLSRAEADILLALRKEPYVSQRLLAETVGHSLGVVNRSLRSLAGAGHLDGDMRLTRRAWELLDRSAPQSAVILAAGYGMRMVPINLETPKGLLEVHGEPLVERLIRQLREAGVRDICVVVGFMKERYEYLIDEFGVELAYNPDYRTKNNLHSLRLALARVSNAYIVPCDIWCRENPFRDRELYSWYMVSDRPDTGSDVRVNRKLELVTVPENTAGSRMIGIAYLREPEASAVRSGIERLSRLPAYDGSFWEAALYDEGRMIVGARPVSGGDVVELDTYEQLRELDEASDHLRSDALDVISRVLGVPARGITDITVMKKGMTNRSFLFSAGGKKYLMRIPVAGSENLVDRAGEAETYRAIAGRGLCDEPVYFDPATGYKLTRYLEDARSCDADDSAELRRCMSLLRRFHDMRLRVGHTFDLFGQIELYESLWGGEPSVYRDYARTKANVYSLRSYIEEHREAWCLTHIDAQVDNFLFYPEGGEDKLQLIDWEYAGMQDPHADIAAFISYSPYDRQKHEQLIDLYFDAAGERCAPAVRAKIYALTAAISLAWSNWCEYKSRLGIEFGEYSLRQYRYAKDYYRLAAAAIAALAADGAPTSEGGAK